MKLSRSLIITSLLILSCASSKEAQEKYRALAVEKYKVNIDYVFNDSKTFVLCLSASKPTVLKPENPIRFFVYDVKNDAVIMEETLADGSVSWINDHAVEVTYRLGVSSKDPSVPHTGKYIFDMNTKQKSTDKSETK